MMRFDPQITVKRLVVKTSLGIAYDESFHIGVNIVRGANSSGKSTILNFVFYGLGGDLSQQDWSEHALKCKHVWLEVELNGKPAVFRREIVENSLAPMEIFGGRYESASTAPVDDWLKYPYRRGTTESFSQAIFRLLGMPDVAVEGTSSVTMHQILRLLYADQLSPIDNLFRFEGYDPENLREAVGNLLCGAFDAQIYELQQKTRTKEKEFSEAAAELRSIFQVVGGDESLGLDWVKQQNKSLQDDREKTLVEIEDTEERSYDVSENEKITYSEAQKLYKEVSKLQFLMQASMKNIDALEFEIADSDEFIRTLERRVEALKDAEAAAELVETIHFSTCPACYAEVLEHDHEIRACHLCKTPLDNDRARERIVGLINESSIQIKQSRQLQAVREEKIKTARSELAKNQSDWRAKSRELSAVSSRPSTESKEKLRLLHRKIGYIEKSIEENERKLNLANKIHELSSRKSDLDTEIQDLRNIIETLKRDQTKQLRKSRSAIEAQTIQFLKGDLDRQDSFVDPKHIDFSFAKNSITVDDHTYFSASSRVILKSSFLVGFLSAAMQERTFRHPRFLMIDITEDKGMEVERSHNFQEQVVKLSNESETIHQIILATAMPSEKLSKKLFVGRFSTLQHGTLNIDKTRPS